MNKNASIKHQKNLIRHYIRAKDDNKPHMMAGIFSESAILEMKVDTDNISFPSHTIGLDEITNVLVRRFSQSYENVYTFCLSDSITSHEQTLSCHWLVCMDKKDSGDTHVGYGRYDWTFNNEQNRLVSRLVISIENMLVFTPEYSKEIIKWIEELPYPFCDANAVSELMPSLEALQIMRNYIP